MAVRRWLVVWVLGLVAAVAGATASAAPEAELWERWTAHDPQSQARIDHGAWNRFLVLYVVPDAEGVRRVDYGAVSDADRRALDAYVERLESVPISAMSRDEQLAYWINLYNALTVRVVLEHYPVASIRDISISPGLFSVGPWGKKLAEVEGEALSLDDIEHRILRPIWRDPRIHYAVNCAAVGCPNLREEAFTAANAERLLELGAREYVNSSRGVIAVGDRGARVSSIYVWFKEDFGDSDAGVLSHLRAYAEPELERALAGVERIAGHDYDWTLNDAGGVARREQRVGSGLR